MKQILALLIVLLLVPLTASAQDFCKGNFDYDQDVDGSDAAVFKEDFGRSLLKNPCLPGGPSPVPKTGQTTLYVTGDDGWWQKGVPWPNPRFIDNGDGTVKDNLTGLIWLKDANCFGARTWFDALSDCNGLASGQCNLTDGSVVGDWRLPNIRELLSLIDFSNTYPALPSGHIFNNVQNSYYWTSTIYADSTFSAWIVSMEYGRGDDNTIVNYASVWPVRGGIDEPCITTESDIIGVWQKWIDYDCNGSAGYTFLTFYADHTFDSDPRCKDFSDTWYLDSNTITYTFTACDHPIYTGIVGGCGTRMIGRGIYEGGEYCWWATKIE
jgi:hypothetical protein